MLTPPIEGDEPLPSRATGFRVRVKKADTVSHLQGGRTAIGRHQKVFLHNGATWLGSACQWSSSVLLYPVVWLHPFGPHRRDAQEFARADQCGPWRWPPVDYPPIPHRCVGDMGQHHEHGQYARAKAAQPGTWGAHTAPGASEICIDGPLEQMQSFAVARNSTSLRIALWFTLPSIWGLLWCWLMINDA